MSEPAARLRVATVGMTETPTAGMRDYAELLAGALGKDGVDSSFHWLERKSGSLGAERAQIAAWRARLAAELRRERPSALILHYSPFAYSHRGIPIFARSLLATLAPLRIPLITALHELAFPWARRAARQRAWAVTQRVALFDLMRRSSAAVVTLESRAEWLRDSRWLPERPIEVVPVFSNLPAPSNAPTPAAPGTIGLFGYGYEGALMELVLDAIRLLADRREGVRLRLLGGPGPQSDGGERWRVAAAARGLGAAVEFSGVLPAQELSNELASCQLLLSAVVNGPTPRKGTIAASLESGRPLLAIDGPETWEPFIAERALMLARPEPADIAEQAGKLLDDEQLRERLGASGRSFALQRLSLSRGARAYAELIRRLSGT